MNTLKQISRNTCLTWSALVDGKGWQTVRQIGDSTGIPPRSVRAILTVLVKQNLVEESRAHAGFRYRIRPSPLPATTKDVVKHLNAAREFFLETNHE